MRILLVAFGSRGDVQPILALGKGLRAAGYDVTLAAGINFQMWIESEGLSFEPFHVDMEAMVNTDAGKEWLDNSSRDPRAELRNMRRVAETITETVGADLTRMTANADVYLGGLLMFGGLHAMAQYHNKRVINAFLQPFIPTAHSAAAMQTILPDGVSPLNRWYGYLIEVMLYGNVLKHSTQYMREKIAHLPPISRADFLRAWNRTETLYGFSRHIVPPPPDWGTNVHVTGYWFDPAPVPYTPPPALIDFLNAGEPPVYIGFGSMSNRDPHATARMFVEALKRSGRRGIIYSGWAGMTADDLPDNIYMIGSVPHEWLFPRMAAIVHHGGAGTTAAALRAGVPSMVIAHIGDQPYWGRRLQQLGVGVRPIQRHQLTVDNLTTGIMTMTTDRVMQQRAAALGRNICDEDGVGSAVKIMERLLA
jgi:sterol 3beta-glucosyltransferase